LVEAKADVDAANRDNQTPLDYAKRSKKEEVIKVLRESGATE